MKLLATIVALALSVRINSFATIDPGPGVEEPVVANIDAPADAPIQGGFEAPVDEPPVAPTVTRALAGLGSLAWTGLRPPPDLPVWLPALHELLARLGGAAT